MYRMSVDLRTRLAALSPEKRALLERRLQADKPVVATDSIAHRDHVERPPLSFAQQRLWFLEQLEPGGGHYNLPLVLDFAGPVDPAKLEAAINLIVQRHDSLRTRFVLEQGEPCQEIVTDLAIGIEVIDLRSRPATDREPEAARARLATIMQPFDLRHGPMLRAQLLRLSGDRHVLTVTLHHIVADGWSLAVFEQELTAIYGALCRGEPSPLAPLALQYADFALWQRDVLQGERLQRLLGYWTGALAGMPARLELPTDRPRPPIQDFAGGMLVRPYPRRSLAGLVRRAQAQDATLFMALLAVFTILLHRLSGSSDIVIGSPIANRSRRELEQLIGFFVNTLVLRTNLAGASTFRELLDRVRDVTLDAYAHQDLPFERLVEAINPERNLDHNPLFQVMFGMQNIGAARPAQNGPSQLGPATAKFDLTVSVSETDEGITCAFEFSTALFDAATIAALADAFGALIAHAAESPDTPIAALRLTDDALRARLIAQAGTPGSGPPGGTIAALFEDRAAAAPDAVALSTAHETLSYAEVDARANRLAHALSEGGAGRGAVVGLCLDRTLDLPIAMLAVGKAGAAFLPLDPALPADRLAFMLDDAGVALVLTSEDLRPAIPAFAGVVWTMEQHRARIAGHEATPLDHDASPDDLAYVIYTSGSTGRPKGVMVANRGAANAVRSLVAAFDLPAQTRVLQFGSLSFDIAIFDLLMTIASGGTLCLADATAILPGQPLVDILRDRAINVITIPPSALAVTPVTDLPDLHTIVCGGETLSADLASRWQAAGCRVVNAYGPTETTIWATCHDCDDDDAAPPIGRAIAGARVHVLDPAGEPLPPGIPGEIHIGGAGVARGYLGRPGLTAAHYVPDPFAQEPGARLYRTGDRAVLRADGAIRFIGRADHQIKLRGYRIELGEIEAVLRHQTDVVDAAAVVQRTPGGERRIAAFCVVRALGPDQAALLARLRAALPAHMVPAALTILDTLPVTPSGKVDRRALEVHDPSPPMDCAPPLGGTDLELSIAGVYAEVLEIGALGRDAHFFALGGHSLLATRAVTRLNAMFAVALPLRTLFEHPVVADLAIAIQRARAAGDGVISASIPRADRQPVMPAALDG